MKTYLYDRSDSAARLALLHGVSRQAVFQARQPAPSPTFDVEGYPTEETLAVVRDWKIKSNFSIKDLLKYVAKAWRYGFIKQVGGGGNKRWIRVATAGWSGNEDLIQALCENHVFWACCWLESTRGGSYKFLTNPIKELPPTKP